DSIQGISRRWCYKLMIKAKRTTQINQKVQKLDGSSSASTINIQQNQLTAGPAKQAKIIDCSTSSGGEFGGLALLWNSDSVDVEINEHDLNYFWS
ncbi:hypothetical protein A2U01_0015365, partial [Trifolium medium]|nr:hypothetical protein [Trifolium medium]